MSNNADNPFWVLGLPPETSRAEVERAGQKLLAQLELGLAAAAVWQSPSGPRPRDSQAVRSALAELRDPSRRLLWELRAGVRIEPEEEPARAPSFAPWPGAWRALGWPPA